MDAFLDPNDRFRDRRRRARRRRRIRRTVGAIALLLAVAALAAGARGFDSGNGRETKTAGVKPAAKKKKVVNRHGPAVPEEIRGVHVTVALASQPGKLDEYASMPGLNTIQLDIKDENGEIGFYRLAPTLAKRVGAAMRYYDPIKTTRRLHARGVYVIGRIVCFEDPILSKGRPDMAIQRAGGGVWTNHAGLGWTNPYDKRVWNYNLRLAQAAARAGFDEIQFDYVRFPSDGDIQAAVYPRKVNEPKAITIARFVHYATNRLRPMGVRVSVDVFGLSATRELGIGQSPRRLSKIVDAIYPMVYPSHYGPGEYGLDNPVAVPGTTVDRSLGDFRRQMRRGKADLIPWLEDFSFSGSPTYDHVREQIRAAREWNSRGFLLWNAAGVYTRGALTAR